MRRSNKDRFHDLIQEEGYLHLLLQRENLANEKKEQLLKMAVNGDPRPNQRKHPLGIVLNNYINSNNTSYDLIFTKKIRELRPDWFITQSDKAKQKKEQLLKMAKNGDPRPNCKKHPLGNLLLNYTSPNNGCYDLVFKKKIMNLRPDWFITQSDKANQKKKQLLEMAKSGKDRPNKEKHPLGKVLGSYIDSNHRSYDLIFTKKIKRIRPDWFVKSSDEKKKQLLKMAKEGKDKSYWKTKLGSALCSYISLKSDCYDPEFDKKIRKLRSDWFRRSK